MYRSFHSAKLLTSVTIPFHQIATVSSISPKKLRHVPVMHNEVINFFKPKSGEKYLDMTFGAGGHSKQLLNSAEDIVVYALDRDPVAYELAIQAASEAPSGSLIPLLGKFSDLPDLLCNLGVTENFFDGILVDCGCSSMQFDTKERGFSISKEGPLDMRMDNQRPSAADVLAHIDEDSLARILKVYGEERLAKKIARAVIEARYLFKSLKTTTELAQLVESVCGFQSRSDKLQRPSHVATKTFQALRIFVNDELNELDFAMKFAYQSLKVGGKIVTLSFHSLEDRIIKNALHGMDNPPEGQKYKVYGLDLSASDMKMVMEKKWQSINKHVLTPSNEEMSRNPRSRSAKLRAALKVK